MATTVSKIGTEILVNTATAGTQHEHKITALSNGGFVVTWEDQSLGVGGATGDDSFAAVKAQVFAANGTPIGSELLVNTATTFRQSVAQITALSDGGFVVTWEDTSAGVGGASGDSTSTAVKAQVFAANGTRIGSELLVNTATDDGQNGPEITALTDGGFVVTWRDFSNGVGGATGDSSSTALKAQVFAAGGTRIGTELLVNTATANSQTLQQITALSNGGFVVTWDDFSAGVGGATGDNDGRAVKAQVFAADGTPIGTERLINTAVAGDQSVTKIATLSNGGFVVTWRDDSLGVGGATGDTSFNAVKAQVFAANGAPVGAELRVNTATAGFQADQQIAALTNGGFVVTWTDDSRGVGGTPGDNSDFATKAQVFAADGTRVGTEILVNTAVADDQDVPKIQALANGAFVIAWNDDSLGVGGATGDGSNGAMKAQVFLADGTRVGSEILVNTATTNLQFNPQIAALANGGFAVAWGDVSQGVGGATGDTSGQAVKAQVFSVNFSPVITSNGGGDNASVAVAEITKAVTTVTAADPDPGTALAFSIIGGADAAKFKINATTGALSFVAIPNFEAPADSDTNNSYVVQVRASDGNLTDEQTITVNIVDATENDGDGNFLFDTPFYLSNNPDVFAAGVNALSHFNAHGFREGRDPNPFFDTSFYLAVNRDVAASGVNPLDHFHQTGWKQGRDPGPNFDTTLYLLHNPDVAAAGIDPLEHFLQFGQFEGRDAFPAIGTPVNGFDAQFYILQNPDVAAAGVDPLVHFNTFGRFEARNPNAIFDTAGYLSAYADVAAAGVNPLDHYMAFGAQEGRDPSAGFDTLGYLAANPDVAAAGVNPLQHFLQFGIFEGRTAINDGLFD